MSSDFSSIYPDFLQDCSAIIGGYLAQYGFVESIRDDVDLFMEFRNTHWAIQVDFLSGFPHLGIGMGFACVDGRTTVPGLLDQARAPALKLVMSDFIPQSGVNKFDVRTSSFSEFEQNKKGEFKEADAKESRVDVWVEYAEKTNSK